MTKFSNARQTVAAAVMAVTMATLFLAGAVAPAVYQPVARSPLAQLAA